MEALNQKDKHFLRTVLRNPSWKKIEAHIRQDILNAVTNRNHLVVDRDLSQRIIGHSSGVNACLNKITSLARSTPAKIEQPIMTYGSNQYRTEKSTRSIASQAG